MGLMLIFTGFYGFYAACLVITSTSFPGWLNIYLSPTTLGSIFFAITVGFAGGFTGGFFASKGDPFWTLSGGLAGVISVSAGADVYSPSLDYLLSIFGGGTAVFVGHFIERKMRVDDAVGAVAVHGYSGFLGIMRWDLRHRIPDGHQQRAVVVRWPDDGSDGVPPAGLLRRLRPGLDSQKGRAAASPLEVELRGLDIAEYGTDFYPEFARLNPRLSCSASGESVPSEVMLYQTPTSRCGGGTRYERR